MTRSPGFARLRTSRCSLAKPGERTTSALPYVAYDCMAEPRFAIVGHRQERTSLAKGRLRDIA